MNPEGAAGSILFHEFLRGEASPHDSVSKFISFITFITSEDGLKSIFSMTVRTISILELIQRRRNVERGNGK